MRFTGNLEYQTKSNYSRFKKCCSCKNPYYEGEYTIEDFIDLITRGIFEPVDFYLI